MSQVEWKYRVLKDPKKEEEKQFKRSFEIISQERSTELWSKAVIEGDRGLTREMIAQAELHPIAEIDLGKIKMGISKKFSGTGDYESFLGYVDKDGEVLLCTFYKSNSSNMWRYLPGYHESESSGIQFSKGHEGENSEDTLNLPMEVQKSLHDFFNTYNEQVVSNNDFVSTNRNTLFLGTTKNLDNPSSKTRYFQEIPKQKESRYGAYLLGDFKSSEQSSEGRMSLKKPEDIYLIEKQNPNFGEMITTWEDSDSNYQYYPNPNSIAGTVEPIIYRLYKSKDGELTYTFATTKHTHRTFIASIEKTDSEYTSFGTKYQYIDAGCLTTPAQEYYSQTYVEGTNFGESYATRIRGGANDLYEKYISKIKMVQDFENSIKKM